MVTAAEMQAVERSLPKGPVAIRREGGTHTEPRADQEASSEFPQPRSAPAAGVITDVSGTRGPQPATGSADIEVRSQAKKLSSWGVGLACILLLAGAAYYVPQFLSPSPPEAIATEDTEEPAPVTKPPELINATIEIAPADAHLRISGKGVDVDENGIASLQFQEEDLGKQLLVHVESDGFETFEDRLLQELPNPDQPLRRIRLTPYVKAVSSNASFNVEDARIHFDGEPVSSDGDGRIRLPAGDSSFSIELFATGFRSISHQSVTYSSFEEISDRQSDAFVFKLDPDPDYYIELAEVALREGQWDLAFARSESALVISPGSSIALLFRGRAHLGRALSSDDSIAAGQDFNDAVKDFTDSIDSSLEDASRAEALHFRGLARWKLDEMDTVLGDEAEHAIRDFEAALDLPYTMDVKSDLRDLLVKRGTQLLAAENFDLAILDFERARELDGNDESILRLLASALSSKGLRLYAEQDFTNAIGVLGDAINAFTELNASTDQPQLAKLHAARADCHYHQQNTDGAIKDYAVAIDIEQRAEYFVARGIVLQSDAKPIQAVNDYTAAINLKPIDPQAFVLRGMLYVHLEDEYQQAITDFETALKNGYVPGVDFQIAKGKAHIAVGKAHLAEKQYRESEQEFRNAINTIDEVLKNASDDELSIVKGLQIDTHRGYAKALFCNGDVDQAIRSLTFLIEKGGDQSSEALSARGYCQLRQSLENDGESADQSARLTAAIGDFEASLQIDQDDPFTREGIAIAYTMRAESGDLEKATSILNTLLARDEQDPWLHELAFEALARRARSNPSDADSALAHREQAIRLRAKAGTEFGTAPSSQMFPCPCIDLQFSPAPKPSFEGNVAGEIREFVLGGGVKLEMVWCPPGRIEVGTTRAELDSLTTRFDLDKTEVQDIQDELVDEKKTVILTNGFWLGQSEITQSQWLSIMGNRPWKSKGETSEAEFIEGGDHPAGYIDYFDATDFCINATKSLRDRLDSNWRFALPTEAQWEYACRTGRDRASGDNPSSLVQFAWFDGNINQKRRPQPVRQKSANVWNLYDMQGNMREWCRDSYRREPPEGKDPPVKQPPKTANSWVTKGGSVVHSAVYCRAADRTQHFCFGDQRDINIFAWNGFRVALVKEDPQRAWVTRSQQVNPDE